MEHTHPNVGELDACGFLLAARARRHPKRAGKASKYRRNLRVPPLSHCWHSEGLHHEAEAGYSPYPKKKTKSRSRYFVVENSKSIELGHELWS